MGIPGWFGSWLVFCWLMLVKLVGYSKCHSLGSFFGATKKTFFLEEFGLGFCFECLWGFSLV